ncbi:branched-chain amino acid transport system II carrier protein [Pallidibacillus pasinlerensis]|uniref:Branched-chain amino acid transport system carrier protein n=1 Tax=Pallidibacillus pasinlerensis TaxID=2703818 RepID=A0ABX0AB32_9BACI|nr:branched-chain amino acid transport system II carrier protein [Pallidibacillus pasinlerensis]NCU18383.1 branched-chain amino acid transport system II carrier protein [Pallidibacillus pasinlerensis]
MADKKVAVLNYFAIGFMLFALFFGAGNLIFPAQLGQQAGTEFWPAIIGFLVTGVGLPLAGVIAIGYSGTNNLQELSSRVHPYYGIFFTSLLYLTIGPFFAIPRTATVPYETSIASLMGGIDPKLGLFLFSVVFFVLTLWLSLNPSKIVDRIGKVLSPALVALLLVIIVLALINPIDSFAKPQGDYATGSFVKGFLEGYNTMDALASLVFAIIVINAVKAIGVKNEKGILLATAKSGVVAAVLLGVVYVGIAFMGGISVNEFGYFDNGGPVLSGVTGYYLGTIGSAFLAIVMFLACLTTSVGLIVSCAEYFNRLLPKFSYKTLAVFFTLISFIIANFGLTNIITYSIPVLMFLYPLTIVLMILTFVSPLFNHSRVVYVGTIAVTFFFAIIDGLTTLFATTGVDNPAWLQSTVQFLTESLPLYGQGLGWVLPAVVAIVVFWIISKFVAPQKSAEVVK